MRRRDARDASQRLHDPPLGAGAKLWRLLAGAALAVPLSPWSPGGGEGAAGRRAGAQRCTHLSRSQGLRGQHRSSPPVFGLRPARPAQRRAASGAQARPGRRSGRDPAAARPAQGERRRALRPPLPSPGARPARGGRW